jgi:nicotinamide-nucleotide amidase
MNGEIISIGHELLMGEIVDTNSSFFAQRLAEAGVSVRWLTSVGDDLGDICEAVERALGRSEVTITSGGLGPTSDDLTREAVAKVLGEEMKVDPGLLAWLEGVFKQRAIPMPKTNIKQATLIPSAATVPNPTGTAPGWWVTRGGRHIVLTPGPPREIQRMWEETIGPKLARITGAGVVFTRTLKTYGVTEGGIDEKLTDLFGKANPYLGIYARPDGIHLRIISKAPTRAEAEMLAAPLERDIADRLGAAVWGTDDETPASKVISLLVAQGRTLAVADAATGGYVSTQIAATAGHGPVFKGALVSSPESGAVSEVLAAVSSVLTGEGAAPGGEQQALALAGAARGGLAADIGLSLLRTPEGGLFFAAASDRGAHTGGETRRWPRDIAAQRAAVMALIGLAGALARGDV